MNFAEAWALFLSGKGIRIRRASWDKGWCLLMLDGYPYERSDMPSEPLQRLQSLNDDELMATDWEEA